MPKSLAHRLVWSEARQQYQHLVHGQPEQCFRSSDEPAFSCWLTSHTAFAFVGQAGRLSIIQEARERGTGYWYAYRTHHRQTRKRYLGPSSKVTLARLEETAKILTQEFERQAQARASSSSQPFNALLYSRLSPPRLPSFLVERSRLLAELETVHTYPLTLISASAGSGKTTLLSAWASRQRNSVAWLSLDASDTDPVNFWTSCIAALHRYQPSPGEEALALLHASQSPPLSMVLVSLLNDIELLDQEIILILDDFHLIEDQAIYEGLSFLLHHLPVHLHLVLSTRTDPQLPLARLRVKGRLIEVRTSDLRFSQEEAACFLRDGMGLPLSEEDVAILSERTEGWIAGLQLAALSLRKQQDLSASVQDFGGSHRYLLDYVQQDILTRLPQRVQDFLLQTSVVTSMNPALAQAVTALPILQASQQMLEEVERANLFVMPLDSRREWYRYHDLFREALQVRLQASQPELVPLLHIRAARWYETQGELREAITHALAAPDYSLAASLMEQAAPAFWLSGEARTVHTWVLALPDTILLSHLGLALEAALRFLNSVSLSTETPYTSMQIQVERTIMRMEGLLRCRQEPTLSGAEVALIERRLRLLRALIEARGLLKRGDQQRLRHLALEIEALPPDEEASWNMIPLSFSFWLTSLLQQKGALLVPRLLSAKQMMEAGDPLARVRVRTWLADAHIQAGQLHLARQECLEALALIEQTGGRTTWSGYLQYSLFTICYARNRLEEAADWLERSLRSAQDWHQLELLVLGRRAQARLGLARGDMQTAQEALYQLEALVEQEGSAHLERWVRDTRLYVWLAQGNLAEAEVAAAQVMFPPHVSSPVRREEVLMRVRVLLAKLQYTQAVETLERFAKHLDQPGNIELTIHFLALSVMALSSAGKREHAVQSAVRLFALTESEGFIRIYLDAGPPMKQALTMLLETSHYNDPTTGALALFRPYLSRLLAAFEQEEQRLAHTHQQEATATHLPNHQHPQAPLSPLSRQEQQVLRLLVAGQTYAEIAQALIVSPNTIKTQISSIYRKLGVSRRAEAIAVTSRLHLL
jgi:ATP/maltotriose-dependent transcriptional regulator MalT